MGLFSSFRKRKSLSATSASKKAGDEPPPPYQEETVESSDGSNKCGSNRETVEPTEEVDEQAEGPAEQTEETDERSEEDAAKPEADAESSTKTPKTEDKNKPSEVFFCFGPDGTFLLRCDDYSSFSIPEKVIDAVGMKNVASLHAVALTEDGGAILGYEDKNKSPTWVWSKGTKKVPETTTKATEDFYESMSNDASLDRLAHTTLAMGTNGKYFGRTHKTYDYYLPKPLVAKIKAKSAEAEKNDSARVYPLQVALGVNNTWIVLWSDRSWSWDLGSDYDDVIPLLSGKITPSKVPVFVALNPYKAGDYFLVQRKGYCLYSVSSVTVARSQTLRDLTMGYMQKRAKADGTTFTMHMSRTGTTHKMVISPETDFPIGSKATDREPINKAVVDSKKEVK